MSKGNGPLPIAMDVFVYAVATEEEFDQGAQWDRLHDALEAAGFVCDGGSARIMDESDVVPDSPLARKLSAARDECPLNQER